MERFAHRGARLTASVLTAIGVVCAVLLVVVVVQVVHHTSKAVAPGTDTTGSIPQAIVTSSVPASAPAKEDAKVACVDMAQFQRISTNADASPSDVAPGDPGSTVTPEELARLSPLLDDAVTHVIAAARKNVAYDDLESAVIGWETDAQSNLNSVSDACNAHGFHGH